MVLGYETPVARVGRVVAVVAHHPVVIHLECIPVGGLTVNKDISVAHLEGVVLVGSYGSGIHRQVILCEMQS